MMAECAFGRHTDACYLRTRHGAYVMHCSDAHRRTIADECPPLDFEITVDSLTHPEVQRLTVQKTTTVEELKTMIRVRAGCPEDMQRIFHNHARLPDDSRLGDHDIGPGDRLAVVLRLGRVTVPVTSGR